jgi:hypothetical protein
MTSLLITPSPVAGAIAAAAHAERAILAGARFRGGAVVPSTVVERGVGEVLPGGRGSNDVAEGRPTGTSSASHTGP